MPKTFRNPDKAFDDAIQAGVFTEAAHLYWPGIRYARDYMYMWTEAGLDYFKHIATREYAVSSTTIE